MHGFTRAVKMAWSCLGVAMKWSHSELRGPFLSLDLSICGCTHPPIPVFKADISVTAC